MRFTPQAYGTILLAGFCLVQCERDIAIDYSHFEPLLVIHAQLSPDSTIEIAVSSSASPISSKQGEMPEDVTLTLMDRTDSREIPLMKEDATFVSPGNYPVAGHTYHLEASAEGYKAVSAEMTIPDHVLVDAIEVHNYQETPSTQTPNKHNISFDLEMSFDHSERKYLHVLFQQEYRFLVNNQGQPDIYADVWSVEPQFPEEQGLVSHHEQGVLISFDKLNTDELTFNFVDFTVHDASGEEQLGDLSVEVRTVSREYYLFFESLSRQLISRQDPFAEPIPTYNNIHDGLGNFSAYQTEMYRVPIR